MTIEQTKVQIVLSREEALVLFEWLASNSNSASTPGDDSVERAVFCRIEGQLESSLHEVFAEDYDDQLAKARGALAGK